MAVKRAEPANASAATIGTKGNVTETGSLTAPGVGRDGSARRAQVAEIGAGRPSR
jgi:hypothetical protein